MKVTIVRENFGNPAVYDMPEVPQIGDNIHVPEFDNFLKALGGVWTVFRRMWFPAEKAVKIYVQEK